MYLVVLFFKFLSIYSREKTEWAVQVQRGILPLTQQPSGAFLYPEASPNGPNHLHHSGTAAVQPHCADGKPKEKSDNWEIEENMGGNWPKNL